MNRKMRVGWWFPVMGILVLGLTLGMTCKKKNQSTSSFTAIFGGSGANAGNSVQQTSDGGYIIAGYTCRSDTDECDVLLVKADSLGNKVWDETFGGTGDDEGCSVRQTTDGGYIIAGFTNSYGAGDHDVWLIKTDASGNKVWDKTFGGTNWDEGSSVQQASDGGYIIVGYTYSFGAGDRDVWLIKTDSSGNELWDRTFGGTGQDAGRAVQQASDGGYIISGYTESYAVGGVDVWLIKTDSSGSKVWDKTFGEHCNDDGNSVLQTSDGGYIIVGVLEPDTSIGSYVWLIKTDGAGGEVWNGVCTGSGYSEGESVRQASDGGYVITGGTHEGGESRADVWLVKTDASGGKIWDKTFGGRGYNRGNSVQQTTDGGYVVAGLTAPRGAGGSDAWLIKTDADGN